MVYRTNSRSDILNHILNAQISINFSLTSQFMLENSLKLFGHYFYISMNVKFEKEFFQRNWKLSELLVLV